MNRDERKNRARPQECSRFERAGVEGVFPKDPSAGGTWLGVNNFGLTIALLNFYPKSFEPREGMTSRGLLIPKYLEFQDHSEAVQEFDRGSLHKFAPFRLVFLQEDRPVQIRVWNGRSLKKFNRPFEMFFLASSSWSDHFVRKVRTQQFENFVNGLKNRDLGPDHLRQFHFSRASDRSATHLLMNRDDAQTTTISQINVSEQGIELANWWNPQDQTFDQAPSQHVSLPKKS